MDDHRRTNNLPGRDAIRPSHGSSGGLSRDGGDRRMEDRIGRSSGGASGGNRDSDSWVGRGDDRDRGGRTSTSLDDRRGRGGDMFRSSNDDSRRRGGDDDRWERGVTQVSGRPKRDRSPGPDEQSTKRSRSERVDLSRPQSTATINHGGDTHGGRNSAPRDRTQSSTSTAPRGERGGGYRRGVNRR
eukprot:CAMPEP_0116552206 /NCGR_PEP_ID=MMETSP0397-20121206/6363_1 /TAXON_ID=216820 /ORGANISM="Cyclophora tenuis, Strain ECT3854" /LENGTH=185 /DNA_ID=CAMNT_0004077141 /DNA_START=153 /DNA_END=710 /DNA_ORIENTATION=+